MINLMLKNSYNEIMKQPFHKQTSHYFNESVYNTIDVFRIADLLRGCKKRREREKEISGCDLIQLCIA